MTRSREPRRPAAPRSAAPIGIPAPLESAPGPASSRLALGVGLAIALAILLVHIRTYFFLCDDAFISFRYARNLSHGFGLVFNPGFERVEGYSNFLWVLMLAALDRLGALPEQAAPVLSIAATLTLWGLIAVAAARDARPAWTALVAPCFLALNRSFAVWATSGLETRLFELFVIAAVLRLADEVSGARDGKARAPLAGTLFALATLTRPDGLLISASAFACAAVAVVRRDPKAVPRMLLGWAPYAVLVGGHFLFRHAYYGDWLPNTYYAKVGGRLWWDAGLQYLGAFALEYALVLWVPLLAAGVAASVRRGRGFEPALFACALVPHAIYIAAIGGDHFEYRPLDLAFPLAFLLMGRGAGWFATGARSASSAPNPARAKRRPIVLVAPLVLMALAGAELPWQSHRQFPAPYLPGFPGRLTTDSEHFLDSDRDLLYRIPPFSLAAKTHQRLLRTLTDHFIGVRQEEHARFLRLVAAEGKRMGALVAQGVLPRDTYIATGSVGAIPYYCDLRTLDRLGLTDREVARSAPQATRIMAHDRSATLEQGHARGVELWAAHDVHFLWPVSSTQPIDLALQHTPFYAARLDSNEVLLAMLPQGLPEATRRFPRLHFEDGQTLEFLRPYLDRGIVELRDSLARHPKDDRAWRAFAEFLLARGDFQEALGAYAEVLSRAPDDVRALLDSGLCLHMLGRDGEARPLLERLLAIAMKRADEALLRQVRGLLERL